MTIMQLDQMPVDEKREKLFKCCGSTAWVEKMLAAPFSEDLIDLFQNAEDMWNECSEADWKEAFNHHPQIGNIESMPANEASAEWAKSEQEKVDLASDDLKQKLAIANRQYKQKFGYIFIINAIGRTAEDIYAELMVRLQNSAEAEIEIAMYEQVFITRIRLEKLLDED